MRILSFDCGIRNLAVCILEIERLKNLEISQILDSLASLRKRQSSCPIHLRDELNQFCQYVYEYTVQKRFKICFWRNINLFPKQRFVKNITIQKLSTTLVKTLDSYPEFLNVDYVLIEQQPSKNQKMKTFQAMLYSYFIIRGIVDNRRIKSIHLVSPKHKLHGANPQLSQKKGYAKRKELSIKRTLELLNTNTEWKSFLRTQEKKDDLCDAFLQAYVYFEKLNNFS